MNLLTHIYIIFGVWYQLRSVSCFFSYTNNDDDDDDDNTLNVSLQYLVKYQCLKSNN